MPYIKTEQRSAYQQPIQDTVAAILSQGSEIVRAEMVGWWCRYIVRRFAGLTDDGAFNASGFDLDVYRTLRNRADVAFSVLSSRYKENRPDLLLQVAGELNYVMSAVIWGVLGDAPDAEDARYGFRSYLAQTIRHTRDELGRQFDSTSHRKALMLRGVLCDVLDETYRRKTTFYEIRKMSENGDVWTNKQLVQNPSEAK